MPPYLDNNDKPKMRAWEELSQAHELTPPVEHSGSPGGQTSNVCCGNEHILWIKPMELKLSDSIRRRTRTRLPR
jgi:hypothetical protein